MNTNNIEITERFVKERLSGYDSGHDWWHIARVRDMAVHIHKAERKGNRNIIENPKTSVKKKFFDPLRSI